MEVMIYFNSGNRMKLHQDKAEYMTAKEASETDWINHALQDGKIPVILDNVSFIRKYEPPREDDD